MSSVSQPADAIKLACVTHPDTGELLTMHLPCARSVEVSNRQQDQILTNLGDKLHKMYPKRPRHQFNAVLYNYDAPVPLWPWYELHPKYYDIYPDLVGDRRVMEVLFASSQEQPAVYVRYEHPYGDKWRSHGRCMACGRTEPECKGKDKFNTFLIWNRTSAGQYTVICGRCPGIGLYDDVVREAAHRFYHIHANHALSNGKYEAYVRNHIDKTK